MAEAEWRAAYDRYDEQALVARRRGAKSRRLKESLCRTQVQKTAPDARARMMNSGVRKHEPVSHRRICPDGLAGDAWRGPATSAFGSPQSGWAPQ
jgi:hypothetical protein